MWHEIRRWADGTLTLTSSGLSMKLIVSISSNWCAPNDIRRGTESSSMLSAAALDTIFDRFDEPPRLARRRMQMMPRSSSAAQTAPPIVKIISKSTELGRPEAAPSSPEWRPPTSSSWTAANPGAHSVSWVRLQPCVSRSASAHTVHPAQRRSADAVHPAISHWPAGQGSPQAPQRRSDEVVPGDVKNSVATHTCHGVHDRAAWSDRGWKVPSGQREHARSLDAVDRESSNCPGRQNVTGRHRLPLPGDHVPIWHGGCAVGVWGCSGAAVLALVLESVADARSVVGPLPVTCAVPALADVAAMMGAADGDADGPDDTEASDVVGGNETGALDGRHDGVVDGCADIGSAVRALIGDADGKAVVGSCVLGVQTRSDVAVQAATSISPSGHPGEQSADRRACHVQC